MKVIFFKSVNSEDSQRDFACPAMLTITGITIIAMIINLIIHIHYAPRPVLNGLHTSSH